MNQVHLRQRILELFPVFSSLPPAVLDEVLNRGQVRQAPKGTVLFKANSPCRGFSLLLSGTVRVVQLGASGRELELYRVRPGEGCVITMSCLLGRIDYTATGIAETEVTVFSIPPGLFNDLIAREEPFRGYIFGLFSKRLAEVMELVEAVAFQRLDQRLAALLLEQGGVVRTTHQQLADRLGSVREIVSRLLRSFEDRSLVALGREQIHVLNPAALREIAQRLA